ncbi:MAG: hypothetical protein NC924_04740 [Candidatus Omnitrophica bacterium]|nr:hypothetical protein [Candidatus Omnitrophota bacterium]
MSGFNKQQSSVPFVYLSFIFSLVIGFLWFPRLLIFLKNQDNAARYYQAAFGRLKYPTDKLTQKMFDNIITEGLYAENRILEDILRNNKYFFEMVEKAILLKRCDFSFGKEYKFATLTKPIPNLISTRNTVNLLLLRGRTRELNHDYTGAINNYKCALIFCNHLLQERKDSGMVIMLMSLFNAVRGYVPLQQLVEEKSMDTLLLKDVFYFLKACEQDMIFLPTVIDNERANYQLAKLALQKDIINAFMSDEKRKEHYLNKLNERFDEVERRYYSLIRNYASTNSTADGEEMQRQLGELSERNQRQTIEGLVSLLQKDPVNGGDALVQQVPEIFFSMAWPDLIKLNNIYYVCQAKLRILMTAVAVRIYYDTNKKFPDALEELVPDYFESTVIDPWTGEALSYLLTENEVVIYSVGPDRIDNKGLGANRESVSLNSLQNKDLTVSIRKDRFILSK